MGCLLFRFGIGLVSSDVLLDAVPGLLLLCRIVLVHGQIFGRLLTASTLLFLHHSLLVLVTSQREDCSICLRESSSWIRKLGLSMVERFIGHIRNVDAICLIIDDDALHSSTLMSIGYRLLMDRI